MATETYEEKLPCGGALKVTITSCEISYYFPGPDLRYNGVFVQIPGPEIPQYAAAYEDNWREYLKLKEIVPCGGEFSKIGWKGMPIRVGGHWEGVCLRLHHLAINNASRLAEVANGYRYAIDRASRVQHLLKTLV
jgi:hypothetical protein